MKIIHLISGGDVGGAKTHVLSLLQELNKSVQADLVCFMEGDFAEDARKMGISVHIIAGNNLLKTKKALVSLIREGGYDLIHCHGSRGNVMGAMLRRATGLPVVSTVHSDYKLDYMGRPLGKLILGNMNNWALRRMDYLVAVSDAMADILISRRFRPDRFFVIYNGIDFEKKLSPLPRAEFFKKLGLDIPEDAVVAGIGARLNPVKDMRTLVRALALAKDKAPRLHVLIAGEGPEGQPLRDLAKQLGVADRVHFAGWVYDMDSFYNALDINTLTSLSESFPYALTDGTRFNLPTVSSRVGGVPKLIDDEVNGFLFTPGDAETLADRLTRLENDPALREKMGRDLGAKARATFSIASTYATQLEIYRTVLRRFHREKASRKQRDGIVICGAYGRGNAGDEAILTAILREIRSIDPDMPVTVLSRNPRETRQSHRVRAIFTFSYLKFLSALRRSKVFINGGGSLIQDVTSSRSLWFYLSTLRSARRAGCRVIMYGCGIGPVTRPANVRISKKVLDRCVDVITLREDSSLRELESWGISGPQILPAADPTLILPPASETEITSAMLQSGLDPHGAYICFALRKWAGFEEKLDLFAQAAVYAREKYGLTPVFIPMEPKKDKPALEQAAKKLTAPYHILENTGKPELTIGLLSRMRLVLSMRLHGLIFAASQGVPLIGVVYDPKVSSFLEYMGQRRFASLDTLDTESLPRMIDDAMANPGEGTSPLLEPESRNVQALRELLN